MNAATIIRQALFAVDAVGQDDTTDPIFRLPELLTWANEAKDRAEAKLRQAKEDFQLLILQSNDVVFRWGGVDYDPSVLRLTSTTRRVALPPDLLTLKSIRCITAGSEQTRFREADMSGEEFKAGAAQSVSSSTDGELLYDIVGENTLVLACAPSSPLDIEIAYIGRSLPMRIYATGTVTLVQGSVSVSGGGTSWVKGEVTPDCELLVSDDATVPKVVSQTAGGTWVDPSARSTPVSTIDSDGGLTLAGTWLLAGAVGRGYLLATVPAIPLEHHYQIVDGLVARMKLKTENKASESYFALSENGSKDMSKDVTERQLDTIRVVTDYVAG